MGSLTGYIDWLGVLLVFAAAVVDTATDADDKDDWTENHPNTAGNQKSFSGAFTCSIAASCRLAVVHIVVLTRGRVVVVAKCIGVVSVQIGTVGIIAVCGVFAELLGLVVAFCIRVTINFVDVSIITTV